MPQWIKVNLKIHLVRSSAPFFVSIPSKKRYKNLCGQQYLQSPKQGKNFQFYGSKCYILLNFNIVKMMGNHI